ncbi:hypothetical protein HG536_0C00760 [Torulaspora globosa]|uniref:PXA domain-containing protein n=1 Tax=Torulaspora globosa TaxID=48254 RepID=A0A7G3ZEH3_9SACH|nr:uncharacterized protein HG536_0C00760 [Torulaspora globosa]QLL31909.1 hypothetical protein HG536_0C00760 [Torulaspora globosa]
MSTILYNASSSLVPKFQRHNVLRQQRDATPGLSSSLHDEGIDRPSSNGQDDTPFKSGFAKNSDGYLQELCCSVYPTSLHQRIRKLDSMADLPLQALMSLVWQNFVTSWYGVKIPTCDDLFMAQLFDLTQLIAGRLKSTDLECEPFIADDLPSVLSEHIQAMRACVREDDAFYRYCQLTSFEEGYYPQVLTNYVLATVPAGSSLQTTFLQALFNELLMGKIMDRVSEPYFALSAISKLCRKLEARRRRKDKQPKAGPVDRIKKWIAAAGRTIALMTSMDKSAKKALELPLAYTNVFTLIFVDLLKLPGRKPYLYAVGKTLQYWSAKSRSVDAVFQNLFFNLIKQCVSMETNMHRLLILLREGLFPEDNKIGTGTVIPEGDEFEDFKRTCADDLWQAVHAYRLDSVLGVEEKDVTEIIEIICRDKRCNKLLAFRIIDALLARTSYLSA